MGRIRNSVLVTAVLSCIMACDLNTPYHHFEETGSEGWDKEDTLNFSVDTLHQTGTYTIYLEVRTSDLYPYRNLSMTVEEEVLKGTSADGQNTVRRVYPVRLEPRGTDGCFKGLGMSQHDLTKVLAFQYLHHGDSLHFKVYHNMRRLLLPGITDVGIKLMHNS